MERFQLVLMGKDKLLTLMVDGELCCGSIEAPDAGFGGE